MAPAEKTNKERNRFALMVLFLLILVLAVDLLATSILGTNASTTWSKASSPAFPGKEAIQKP